MRTTNGGSRLELSSETECLLVRREEDGRGRVIGSTSDTWVRALDVESSFDGLRFDGERRRAGGSGSSRRW